MLWACAWHHEYESNLYEKSQHGKVTRSKSYRKPVKSEHMKGPRRELQRLFKQKRSKVSLTPAKGTFFILFPAECQ